MEILRSFAHEISFAFHHSQKLPMPFVQIFDDLAELLALLLLSCTHHRQSGPSRRTDCQELTLTLSTEDLKKLATLFLPLAFITKSLMSTSDSSRPNRRCSNSLVSYAVILVQVLLHSRKNRAVHRCSLPHSIQQLVSGYCSAKRPNKSPVCGVEVVGQCERNNREDEVEVLNVGVVSGGSSNARL